MGLYHIQTRRGDTYRGSVYSISLSNSDLSAFVPLDLTDAVIIMQVKKQKTDDESVLEFSTTDSTIVITDPLSGIFNTVERIIEVEANKYYYDIQVSLNTGRVITPVDDTFSITQDVTR